MEHYSDLEVRPIETLIKGDTERVYPQIIPEDPNNTAPEAVPWERKPYDAQAVEAELRPGTSTLESSNEIDKRGKKRCGLAPRAFWLALIVFGFLVVIAVVLGAVLGVVLSPRMSRGAEPEPGNGDSSSTPDGNHTSDGNLVFATSKLTSANWTDPDGYLHRFVFFQDTSSALIVRRWNSQNKTWATNNITDILIRSNNPFAPLPPSTALASAGTSFDPLTATLHLYYLTSDDTISGVAINNLAKNPELWEPDDLGNTTIATWPGSQLAAAWNRCWNKKCDGFIAVAYQRPGDAAINVANSSDFSKSALVVDASRIAQKSSIAMFADSARLTMYTELLVSPTLGRAQENIFGGSFGAGWVQESQRFEVPPPSDNVQLALGALQNYAGSIALGLLSNGTVTGEYYVRGLGNIPIASVQFRDGPADVNFSMIATGEDALFYGISDGKILQYSISDLDPSVFDFMEVVYP
ncbi:hypothetical protein F4808DRAFT_263056 [Astrocystis sublimbata]|nr:hypothetical protein F4808DRAFT_263056 [Astrocystis sublimbata]